MYSIICTKKIRHRTVTYTIWSGATVDKTLGRTLTPGEIAEYLATLVHNHQRSDEDKKQGITLTYVMVYETK